MKTFPAFAFVAALAAFVLLPVNFVIASTALFAAGFLSIVCSDYARVFRREIVVPVGALPVDRSERHPLAS